MLSPYCWHLGHPGWDKRAFSLCNEASARETGTKSDIFMSLLLLSHPADGGLCVSHVGVSSEKQTCKRRKAGTPTYSLLHSKDTYCMHYRWVFTSWCLTKTVTHELELPRTQSPSCCIPGSSSATFPAQTGARLSGRLIQH